MERLATEEVWMGGAVQGRFSGKQRGRSEAGSEGARERGREDIQIQRSHASVGQ